MDPEPFSVAKILDIRGMAGAPYFADSTFVRHVINVRRIDYVEFLFVIAGAGLRIADDSRTRALTPGQLFFLRPIDAGVLEGLGPDGVSLMVVSIPATSWRIFASFVGIDPDAKAAVDPPTATFDVDDPRVTVPFERAIQAFRAGPTGLDLARFLTDAIPLLFTPEPSDGRGRTPAWLVGAMEAMRNEENLRGGVPRLVELAHVSHQYLAVNTRRHLQTTPTRLVNDLRLAHAALLLSKTDVSIGEVARRCGYASPAHFSASFRTAFGVTPRQHRTQSA